jgi:hypothetical protein
MRCLTENVDIVTWQLKDRNSGARRTVEHGRERICIVRSCNQATTSEGELRYISAYYSEL